jgi:cysteine desulfurase
MKIYLDNAATTPLSEEVLESMLPYLTTHFGNPSSIHSHGREARAAIERSRKKIADLLNASPSEIFFTSGGTEADNTAIISAVRTYEIKHAVTTPLEHHAVLHTFQYLEKSSPLRVTYLKTDFRGTLSFDELEEVLIANPGSLVSLMHVNNELGNITDIQRVSLLCQKYNCLFHSDTVQSISHLPIDLKKLKVNFITASAHKFHGPKGTGFLYVNGDTPIQPLLYGGAQERNFRGGTENVAGIVGMARAFELAVSRMESDRVHISNLKMEMIRNLKVEIPGIEFNGLSENEETSLYTILSTSIPASDDNEMLLFNLDINGISVSGGSACTSGSVIGSHVLREIGVDPRRGHVRFSFSRLNTMDEVFIS